MGNTTVPNSILEAWLIHHVPSNLAIIHQKAIINQENESEKQRIYSILKKLDDWVNEKDDEKEIMKIAGVPVDMSVEDSPDVCRSFMVHENNEKVSCVEAPRATHRMLVSASLFCMKFKDNPEEIGFKFNCHNACAATRMIDGKQHTV